MKAARERRFSIIPCFDHDKLDRDGRWTRPNEIAENKYQTGSEVKGRNFTQIRESSYAGCVASHIVCVAEIRLPLSFVKNWNRIALIRIQIRASQKAIHRLLAPDFSVKRQCSWNSKPYACAIHQPPVVLRLSCS